jgi:hypothetical protein
MRARGLVLLGLLCVIGAPAAGQPRAPRAFVPPGACVPIPTTSYVLHRTTTQSSPPDPEYPGVTNSDLGYGPARGVDLDGDGTRDAFVPEPQRGDCVDDMHVALYVVRGTCGHRVGVVVGRLETPAPSARRAGTLPDLVTTELETVQDDPRVPAVQRTHTRTYRFSGGVYRETRHTQSDSVCHHCARVWCDAAPAQ